MHMIGKIFCSSTIEDYAKGGIERQRVAQSGSRLSYLISAKRSKLYLLQIMDPNSWEVHVSVSKRKSITKIFPEDDISSFRRLKANGSQDTA